MKEEINQTLVTCMLDGTVEVKLPLMLMESPSWWLNMVGPGEHPDSEQILSDFNANMHWDKMTILFKSEKDYLMCILKWSGR